jgi:adenine-specific DNA-methyltransferase
MPKPPLTPDPSPKGRGESDLLLPSPKEHGESSHLPPSPPGRGAGGEGEAQVIKYPLPPALLQRIRELRHNATDAERLLWQLLRNRQLKGAKFRRQYPVASYIVDFYCHEARLVIEVDGSGHLEDKQARYDAERTENLEAEGLHVLRFWNHEVLNKTQLVLEVIWDALPLTPDPSPKGRGESDLLPPSPPGRGAGGEGK